MARDASELVYRGIESDTLDYKAAFDWSLTSKAQKAKFVRHALAFANTRGGDIVVGVGEDKSGHPSLYQGLTPEQCHSFDPSAVGSFINSHVDPPIDLSVERPEVDGKRYAILHVKPFTDVPHVATHSIDEELRTGVFYIRTASASSRPCTSSSEMHELIRRALRNQRELLGKLLRGILYESGAQGAQEERSGRIPAEYEESVQYFSRRLGKNFTASMPVLDLAVWPAQSGSARWSMAELRRAGQAALCRDAMGLFPSPGDLDDEQCYATNVSLRGINETHALFWQFFNNGLLHFRVILPDGFFHPALTELLHDACAFAGNYYAELGLAEEEIHVQLSLINTLDQPLHDYPGSNAEDQAVCRIREVVIRESASAATLLSAHGECADHFLREIAVRFNAPLLPQGAAI